MSSPYELELRMPEGAPQRLKVGKKIIVGSADECDIVLKGMNLANRHCVFRLSNGVLTVHNLTKDGVTTIGDVELDHGKKYILDRGDRVTVGQVNFIIRDASATETSINTQSFEKVNSILDRKVINKNRGISNKKAVSNNLAPKINQAGDETKDKTDHHELYIDKKNKKKNALLGDDKGVGFIGRTLAFISEVIFSIFLFSYVNHPLLNDITYKLNHYLFKLINMTSYAPLIQFTKSHFDYSLLKLFSLFCLQNLLFHLFFGVSLPQFLMGITERSSPLKKRIKGVFRSLFGILLYPLFIILDAPTLVRARSFKDLITFSRPVYRGKIAFILGLPLLLALIISPVSAPYLFNKVYAPIPHKEVNLVVKKKIDKKMKERLLKIDSQLKEYNFNISLEHKDQYLFIPKFNITKKKKTGSIEFFSFWSKGELLFKLEKVVDLKNYINIFKKNNFFFQYRHKNLDTFLKTGRMTTLAAGELTKILKNTFSINSFPITKVLWTSGFAFKNHMDLYLEIKSQSSLKLIEETTVTQGRHIRFFTLLSQDRKKMFYCIIKKSKMYMFSANSTKKEKLLDSFNTLVLPNIFPYRAISNSSQQRKDAFALLDGLNKDHKFDQRLISFYKKMALHYLNLPVDLAKVKDLGKRVLKRGLSNSKSFYKKQQKKEYILAQLALISAAIEKGDPSAL